MDWALLGLGYYLLGKFQAALKYIKKGLKIQTDLGLLTAMSWNYSYLCQVHMALGELRKAQNCIEEAISLSEKNNENHLEALARTLLGGIIAKVDPTRLDKAENEIRCSRRWEWTSGWPERMPFTLNSTKTRVMKKKQKKT